MASSKYQIIEQQMGEPMKEILLKAFHRLGSATAVAAELGVQQSTVSQWIMRNRLKIVQTLVIECPPESEAS